MEQDLSEAIKWWQRAADLGSKCAQHNLGLMYYLGRGVEQDYQAAFMWYLKAAKQGSGEAQNSLGAMYFDGLGVERNLIEVYAWFKLAEQGEQEISKLNIGIIESKLS